jgi:predicted DNA-binding transcriptional regulator YafY
VTSFVILLSYNERSEKRPIFRKGKKDEMRADRLLSILLLLQIHQRMTVRELAKRLEVSVRTVYRDMEALNTAGIPITAERGADSGWFLLEGYRTNLTGLNEPEVQALFLPRPSPLLDDLGLQKAAEGAFLKVLAALPALFRRYAEEVRQRIHIDPAGWDRFAEHTPWLSLLQEAIWQERKLFFSYRRRDESVMDYLVDPLGLVAKASIWYLVGMVEQAYRVFRISRIQSGKITDQQSHRPASFDLAVFWAQWSEYWRKQASPRVRNAFLIAACTASRRAWSKKPAATMISTKPNKRSGLIASDRPRSNISGPNPFPGILVTKSTSGSSEYSDVKKQAHRALPA